MRRRSLARRVGKVLGLTLCIFTALGGTVWAAAPTGPGDTASAICQPVTTSRGSFTAALVDPVASSSGMNVQVDVDADGCDIGVYFDSLRTGGTYSFYNVHGAGYYGVFVDGAGPAVDFAQSSVSDIGDMNAQDIANSGGFSGGQHGIGALYVGGATGTIERTQIYDFQKNGTAFLGAGTNVTIDDSYVRGLGPIGFITQNGIEYGDGAAGRATDNVVQDIGPYQPPPGQTPFVAIALLIVNSNPNSIYRHGNDYVDDQNNEVVCPAQNKFCSGA